MFARFFILYRTKKIINMKLTKKILISKLKPRLESLGFIYFQNSKSLYQGTFIMKVDENMFLTLSLIIDRYYDSKFTGTYYLSPTTNAGTTWGDIPKDSDQRPGYILTEEEFLKYSKDGNLIARDIWFDGFDDDESNTFVEIISLTYKRFSSDIELRNRINQSKDVQLLSKLAQETIEIATKGLFAGELEFIPEKELDGIPINWFEGAETVIRKEHYYLNKNTVVILASDAYRQFVLNHSNSI